MTIGTTTIDTRDHEILVVILVKDAIVVAISLVAPVLMILAEDMPPIPTETIITLATSIDQADMVLIEAIPRIHIPPPVDIIKILATLECTLQMYMEDMVTTSLLPLLTCRMAVRLAV